MFPAGHAPNDQQTHHPKPSSASKGDFTTEAEAGAVSGTCLIGCSAPRPPSHRSLDRITMAQNYRVN